jgi:hypothetical protein
MNIKINIHVLFYVSELSSLVYQTKKMVEDARLYTWQLWQNSIRSTYSPDVHCKELLPCQLICYQLLHWPTKSQQTAFSPCHRRYLGENKTTDKCKKLRTEPSSNFSHVDGRLHKSASAHPCSIGDPSLPSSSSEKSKPFSATEKSMRIILRKGKCGALVLHLLVTV